VLEVYFHLYQYFFEFYKSKIIISHLLVATAINNSFSENEQQASYEIEPRKREGGVVVKGLKDVGRDEMAERVKIDGNVKSGATTAVPIKVLPHTLTLPLSLSIYLSLSPSPSQSLFLPLSQFSLFLSFSFPLTFDPVANGVELMSPAIISICAKNQPCETKKRLRNWNFYLKQSIKT